MRERGTHRPLHEVCGRSESFRELRAGLINGMLLHCCLVKLSLQPLQLWVTQYRQRRRRSIPYSGENGRGFLFGDFGNFKPSCLFTQNDT